MTYFGQVIYLLSGIFGIVFGYICMVASYDDSRWYMIVLGFMGLIILIGGIVQLIGSIRLIFKSIKYRLTNKHK